MEKVAYLRTFGIPEIDNVNRKYYERFNCRIIEDTDGSIFEHIINNEEYDIIIDIRTVSNMLMYNIDVNRQNNSGKLPLNTVISNKDWLGRTLNNRNGLSRYKDCTFKFSAVASDIECALTIAVTQSSNLEIMMGVA